MTDPMNNNMPPSGGQPGSAYQATYGQHANPMPVEHVHAGPAHASEAVPTNAAHASGAVSGAHVGAAHASSAAPGAAYVPSAAPTGAAPVSAATSAAAPAATKTSGGFKTFALGFAGALVACILFFGVSSFISGDSSGDGLSIAPIGPSASIIDSEDDDPTLAEAVAAKCLPSVAAIDVYASSSDLYGSYYGFGLGMGMGSSDELVEYSLGSGVVLSSDGLIITNYHVVEGGSAFDVTIDGQVYEAEMVGSDPSSDIAVLKAKGATGLTAIEIGDSDSLIIGEWVMSIGSPFGLEQSVATGIVSATSRSQIMDSSDYGTSGEVTIYPNMIQTDAAINPGNSGGALVDAQGRLIGINTLITSYSGNYSGVGFAIPVNYAVSLANQIIAGEEPSHAQLGVSLTTINANIADRYDFAVDAGAYITSVVRGSGADEAGLREGDIVTAFDGKPVESASDLMLDVRTKNPGDVVTLTVNRDGENMEVEVTLGSDTDNAETMESGWLNEMFRRGGGGSDV